MLQQRACRIGLDPIDRVFLIENHDHAYHIWCKAGVKRRCLVHIDAHHDMWWIDDLGSMTIANYLCPALKDNLVREVYWVVPDRTWETKRTRRAVLRHVQKIVERYPGPRRIAADAGSIYAEVLRKPLTVCSLGSLPAIRENVLLDIDVDFMTIPAVSYGTPDTHAALPWCWPDTLLARIAAREISTDLVTVAYSVEGGFTPLKWKYLGDELAVRLRPGAERTCLEGMRSLREAAVQAHGGNVDAAEANYQRAARLMPESAAPVYHLACLYAETGRIRESRIFYQRALASDRSYRTPYSSAGFSCYWNRRFREAEEEFRRTLTLDPDDPFAHLGLGQLAARKRRWKQAAALLHKSIDSGSELLDAYDALGHVLAKQGRRHEAIAVYERSLTLGLTGRKSLVSPITTCVEEERRLNDPRHFVTFGRLARLHAQEARTDEAIARYRMSMAGGCDGVLPRTHLAYLHVKQKAFNNAAVEMYRAAMLVPGDVNKAVRRIFRRFCVAVRGRFALLALKSA